MTNDPQSAGQTNLQRILAYLHRMSWLAGIGIFMYLGQHNGDGGFVKELWEQAKVASPFAACLSLFLLFDQVRERREAQKQCLDRTIEFIQSNNAANSAMEKMVTGAKGMADELSEVTRVILDLSGRLTQRKGR